MLDTTMINAMNIPFWKCEICGFEAKDADERAQHLEESAKNPLHQQEVEGPYEED